MEGRLFCDVVEIGKRFATIVNGKVIDDILCTKDGMSCITTKLEGTRLTSIALSVFVTNLFRI